MKRAFWLRVQPANESFRKTMRVTILLFNQRTVPHGMKIPRLMTVWIDRLAEHLHLHIIASTVVIIPGMKRLVEVTDKVDDILQSFLTLREICGVIREECSEPLDLSDYTLVLRADLRGVILRIRNGHVHIMPRRGLFVTHLVSLTGRV